MIVKRIRFFGQDATHACDGRCDKAWGINVRPTIPSKEDLDKSADPDDYAFLADGELGTAPADPGTREGWDAKPLVIRGSEDVNKWCVRECERAWISPPGNPDAQPELKDFSARRYNKAPHTRSQ